MGIFSPHIRFFKDEDWPAFQDFTATYFHKKYILLDKNFVEWQYRTPFSKDGQVGMLVLPSKDKILGFLGVIPLQFNYFGKATPAVCLANLMTDLALRNKGVGVDFVQSGQAQAPIVYTTGYNEDMYKLYTHLHWTTEIILHRYIKVLSQEKVAKLAGVEHKDFAYIPEKELQQNAFSFQKIKEFDAGITAFWEKVKSKYSVTVVRNKEYLNWRYAHHPEFTYSLFVVKDASEIKGFSVVRFEKIDGYVIGRIIDCMAEDNAEEYLFKSIIDYCKKEGADMIDCMFSGSFHDKALTSQGFVEANEEPFTLLPIRFSPIDFKRKTINLAYAIDPKLSPPKNIAESWYVTKGDGDQDRPNPR